MVEFLHWRIYSGCVYFIYPCLCSYPKLEGFVSSPLSPWGSWGRVGEKPSVAPWGAPVSVTHHFHPKSMGNPVILGTNSTPGTRGDRALVSAEPLDASTPPQQPVLARITGLMCETPVWDQHHLHLASLWPSSTKSSFFFLSSPFPFIFWSGCSGGHSFFAAKSHLVQFLCSWVCPRGSGLCWGPGETQDPRAGWVGIGVGATPSIPGWNSCQAVAVQWHPGGQGELGWPLPFSGNPCAASPNNSCVCLFRTTSGITNYWLFLGGGDKFCFFHDFLWLTLAVKLFCSTAKVYFGVGGLFDFFVFLVSRCVILLQSFFFNYYSFFFSNMLH